MLLKIDTLTLQLFDSCIFIGLHLQLLLSNRHFRVYNVIQHLFILCVIAPIILLCQ